MADTDTTTALPETPPRRRLGRYVLLAIVLAIVLPALAWAGIHGYQRVLAQRELDEAIVEISRTDPKWRMADLDVERKRVPDDQNSAQVVMEAMSLLPQSWEATPPALRPHQQLTPQQLEELKTALQSTDQALAKAATLANYAEGRFPTADLKDPRDASKNSTDARAIAQLLRMQAMVLAQNNDVDGALQAALNIAGAARAIGDEPCLLAQMTRNHCRIDLVICLERTMAQGQPAEELLAKAQQALEEEARAPSALRAARGERAAHHELALSAEQGNIALSKVLLQVLPPEHPLADTFVGPLSGTQARIGHARMLRLLTELVELTKLPPEEQRAPTDELNAKWNQLIIGNYQLFPELDKRERPFPGNFRLNLAHLRTAIVALAVERYRRANNNRWPEKVEDLTPTQLEKIPTDPFGGTIRLERRKDGVSVVCRSRDVTMKEETDKKLQSGPNAPRMEFRLFDVAQRRQPPAANEDEELDAELRNRPRGPGSGRN